LNAEDKKKKIGILTLNQQLNYGGVLQSYALQRYLRNQGYDAEVITYWLSENNAHLKGHYWFDDSVPLLRRAINAVRNEYRKGFVFAEILRRWRTIKFIQRYIRMSEKVYRNADELKAIDGYDAIIVGSDQVWNTWHGHNNPFLLNDIQPQIKKTAYAPSFGVNEIPAELQNEYSVALKKFVTLSCREKSGVDMIEELTGRNAEWVVDPVLLLNQEEWNREFSIQPASKDYILCYWLGNFPDIIPTLHKIAKREKKKIYLFLRENFSGEIWDDLKFRAYWRKEFANDPHIRLFRSAGPKEFLSHLAGASAVISDSFHALMFSAIYQKPVRIIINSVPDRKKMADRMKNFCEKLALTECLSYDIERNLDCVSPYTESNSQILSDWIMESKSFLLHNLGKCCQSGPF
jgi:hypothetical protein